jgi:cobaltochelatase CobS
VNDLSLADLHIVLAGYGLDPAKITADALATAASNSATITNMITTEALLSPERMAVATSASDDDNDAPAAPDAPDAIEAEVQTIRSLIVQGGFSALDDRLRELVTEARKPAVEIVREIPAASVVPGHVHVARQTGQTATWRKLFGVTGDLGKQETTLWDGSHPDTPRVNDRYVWPQPATAIALTQLHRGNNVMFYGPAGTGKTEWAQQLAARTGRPFALISCDNGTEAAVLVGVTVPAADGGVAWQDGQLTRAIQTPGCVVCLDEPSVARPGALFVMQNVLQYRELFIAETGRRVKVAPGVLFLTTDNTNGTGGGARRGYTDTNRLNAAFLDRWAVRIAIDYMAPAKEADVIVAYTGCPVDLARLLVSAATVTRAAAADQSLSHGIGLRRLLPWAQLLVDGIDAEAAFQAAVLNCAPEQDVEALREQCLLAYDRAAVAKALNPAAPAAPVVVDPTIANPTLAGRHAASEFTAV